jgi:Protein kinase domain
VIFCSNNRFTRLPEVLGRCPNLTMLGFKANRIAEVPAAALPPGLRWLILTDNALSILPAEIGRCVELQKLMLAGNQLTALPADLAACTRLELIRLAANQLPELPSWLLALPHLAWLAYAGNPCVPPAESPAVVPIPWAELTLGERLGEGASGVIQRAIWRGAPVALKLFKGAMTSDGLPGEELAACLHAGAHPRLIPLHGRLIGHPQGTDGLVLDLLPADCAPLAGPPSLASCTRDVYASQQTFTADAVHTLVTGLAAAAAHLHARGIIHGDFYAHNVAWNPHGACFLGDFGAASRYAVDGPLALALERIEVLAFGHLVGELLARCADSAALEGIRRLHRACTGPAAQRPRFNAIQVVC